MVSAGAWEREYRSALVSGDLEEALGVIAAGRADMDQLVTHTLPLGEIQRGFEMMVEAKESLKIIVDPRLDRQ